MFGSGNVKGRNSRKARSTWLKIDAEDSGERSVFPHQTRARNGLHSRRAGGTRQDGIRTRKGRGILSVKRWCMELRGVERGWGGVQVGDVSFSMEAVYHVPRQETVDLWSNSKCFDLKSELARAIGGRSGWGNLKGSAAPQIFSPPLPDNYPPRLPPADAPKPPCSITHGAGSFVAVSLRIVLARTCLLRKMTYVQDTWIEAEKRLDRRRSGQRRKTTRWTTGGSRRGQKRCVPRF